MPRRSRLYSEVTWCGGEAAYVPSGVPRGGDVGAERMVHALQAATTPAEQEKALMDIRLSASKVTPSQWLQASLPDTVCSMLVGTGRPLPEYSCKLAAGVIVDTLRAHDRIMRSFFQLAMGVVRSAAPAVCALIYTLILAVNMDSSTVSVLQKCDPIPVLLGLYRRYLMLQKPRKDSNPSEPLREQDGSHGLKEHKESRVDLRKLASAASDAHPPAEVVVEVGVRGKVRIPRLNLSAQKASARGNTLLSSHTTADRIMRLVSGRAGNRPALSNCRLSNSDMGIVIGQALSEEPGSSTQYEKTLLHLAHKLGQLYATQDLPSLLHKRRSLGVPLPSSPIRRHLSKPTPPPHVPPEHVLEGWYNVASDQVQCNRYAPSLRLLVVHLLSLLIGDSPAMAAQCVDLAMVELDTVFNDTGTDEETRWLSAMFEHILQVSALCLETAPSPLRVESDPVLHRWTELVSACATGEAGWQARQQYLRVLADYVAPASGTKQRLPAQAAEVCLESVMVYLRHCTSLDAFSSSTISITLDLLRFFTTMLSSKARTPELDAFLWYLLVQDNTVVLWIADFSKVALQSSPSPFTSAFAGADKQRKVPTAVSVVHFWIAYTLFLKECFLEGVPLSLPDTDEREYPPSSFLVDSIRRMDFLYSPFEGAMVTWLVHEPLFEDVLLKEALLHLVLALVALPSSPMGVPSVAASYSRLHFLTMLQTYHHPRLGADSKHIEICSMHLQCLACIAGISGDFLRGKLAQLGVLDFLLVELGLEANAETRRKHLLSLVDEPDSPKGAEDDLGLEAMKPSSGRLVLSGSMRKGGGRLILEANQDVLSADDSVEMITTSEIRLSPVLEETARRPAVPILRLASVSPALWGVKDPPIKDALNTSTSALNPQTKLLDTSTRSLDPPDPLALTASSCSSSSKPPVPPLRLGSASPATWGVCEPSATLSACTPPSLVPSPQCLPSPLTAVKGPLSKPPPSPKKRDSLPMSTSDRPPRTPLEKPAAIPPLRLSKIDAETVKSDKETAKSSAQHAGSLSVSSRQSTGRDDFLTLRVMGSLGEETYPIEVLKDPDAFHEFDRESRTLYRHPKLHAWMVTVVLVLLVDPSPDRTLDMSYDNMDAFNILYAHLNHSYNVSVVSKVLEALRALRSTKALTLLKLIATTLFPAALYRPKSKIGGGAYGAVFVHEVDNGGPTKESVAMKQISAHSGTFADTFAEVLIMEMLQGAHGVGVPLLDFGCDGLAFCIVMPVYPHSLRQWRTGLGKDAGTTHYPMMVHIYQKVIECVEHLHHANVVHFDIKCDNVLLSWPTETTPIVSLCDFGEALFTSETARAQQRVRGTECIRSPEVLLAYRHGDFDRRRVGNMPTTAVDVWALGCLLYELVTGSHLFQDDQFPRFFKAVTDESVPVLDEPRLKALPPHKGLVDFLLLALNRDPKGRPSVRDLANAAVMLGDPTPSPSPFSSQTPSAPWAAAAPSREGTIEVPLTAAAMKDLLLPAQSPPVMSHLVPLHPAIYVGEVLAHKECATLGISLIVSLTNEKPHLRWCRAEIIALGHQVASLLVPSGGLPALKRPVQHGLVSANMKRTESQGALSTVAKVMDLYLASLFRVATEASEGRAVAVIGPGDSSVLLFSAYLCLLHGLTAIEAQRLLMTTAAAPYVTMSQHFVERITRIVQALVYHTPAEIRSTGWYSNDSLRHVLSGTFTPPKAEYRCLCGACSYGGLSSEEVSEGGVVPPPMLEWWNEVGQRMKRLWALPSPLSLLVTAKATFIEGNTASCTSATAPPTMIYPASPAGMRVYKCTVCHYPTHGLVEDGDPVSLYVVFNATILSRSIWYRGGSVCPKCHPLAAYASPSSSPTLHPRRWLSGYFPPLDLRPELCLIGQQCLMHGPASPPTPFHSV